MEVTNKVTSFIVGLLLGLFIGYIFIRENNYMYHGDDSKEIYKQIFKEGDKYYRYVPKICICKK